MGFSTIIASVLVTNDIINSLSWTEHCAAMFFSDLSKALGSAYNELLLDRFSDTGLSYRASLYIEHSAKSSFLKNRIPQGLVLGPVLFSIFN